MARPVAARAAGQLRTTILADFCQRTFVGDALFLARKSFGDACVYTCTCTVHDKLSCTRLQNYTTGASLKSVSVSVSVLWNLALLISIAMHHSTETSHQNTFCHLTLKQRRLQCPKKKTCLFSPGISQELHVQTSRNFLYTCNVAAALFSVASVVCYVLPVLRMTSSFHAVGHTACHVHS